MNSLRILLVALVLVLASAANPQLRAQANAQNRRDYQSTTGGYQLFGTTGVLGNPMSAVGATAATPAVPPPPPAPGERRTYTSSTGGITVNMGKISIGTTTGALPAGPAGRREFNGVR
jgi:hypothetical protein